MNVKARPVAAAELTVAQVDELFRNVNELCAAGATEQFHRAWHLYYEGLPWVGELWLDDKVRLSPASRQDQLSLIGPRIIIVNSLVDAIDGAHAASAFAVQLRELSVFLSIVMGRAVRVSPNGLRGWTWNSDSKGQVDCEIRSYGYWEFDFPRRMPIRGELRSVSLKMVQRPDHSERGLDGSQTEEQLPDDVCELWSKFRDLPSEKLRQLLQVGTLWQLALSLGHEYETARFALMVATCEALKPYEDKYWRHNLYHVIAELLGNQTASGLKGKFRPQDVRSEHFHRGEFRGSEFVLWRTMSSFEDPTFAEGSRELYRIAQNAIIEWIRRRGIFSMPKLKQRSWFRRHIAQVLLAALFFALGVGFDWLLRNLFSA